MKALFVDCDDATAALWAKIHRAGDPPIALNTAPVEPAMLPDLLAGYEICLDDHSSFPAEILERCPALRHIIFLGTGAGSYIDLAAAARLGIGVATIRGYGDTAVAEHAVALMMAAAREVAAMDREIRAGQWRPRQGVQLRGKVLGILGLGGVGREVARIAAGIGMRVVAWNRTPRPECGVPLLPLGEVLARADILSLHLALDDETAGFLDARRLVALKPGVILVNTARGGLVATDALIVALRRRHVRHAALDVFDDEPLPAGHPLTTLPNVTLTAHSAFSTQEAMAILLRRAIDIARDLAARGA